MKSFALPVVAFLVTQPCYAQPPPAAQAAELAELLVAYPSTRYFFEQTEIARRLVAIGDPVVIATVEPYLDTTDRRRRCNAAFVLAGLGDERGVRALIEELEDAGIERRKTEDSPRMTGGIPTPESLARQQAVSDRYFAALLLGELRAEEAVPALIRATRDPAIAVRDRAAMSLGEIGDPSAVPALREMLDHPPDQRISAGYALAALGDPDGFEVLAAGLADSEWVRRRYAVWGLGKTADPRAVPILLPMLRDEHANVRVAAAQELGKIGDPSALPALRAALGDDEVTQVNAPTTTAAEARKAIESIERRGAR
jgi:HEAT repeat protein